MRSFGKLKSCILLISCFNRLPFQKNNLLLFESGEESSVTLYLWKKDHSRAPVPRDRFLDKLIIVRSDLDYDGNSRAFYSW